MKRANSPEKKERTPDFDDERGNSDKKRNEKNVERPEGVKKRDSVMFGFMMNHLKKAKTVLENENSLVYLSFKLFFLKKKYSSKNRRKCLIK